MKESKLKVLWDRCWIFLLYALGILVQRCLLSLQKNVETNPVNTTITIVFFAIIMALFVIVSVCQGKGLEFRNNLKYASSRIRELKQKNTANIQEELFEEELFSEFNLKKAFSTYREDSIRMKAISEETDVDIENYINNQLLEDSTVMHFLNQITGTMTGLGILGTFIGLSIGLSHFNFTGADIASEIQPLMDGIKVAFHTSIVGLIYSLLYGFFYNMQLSEERQVLDDFLADYRKYVVPVTDDGSAETFVKYQQKIVELLGTQILNQQEDAVLGSKILQEQEKLNLLTESVNKQSVEKITDSIQNAIIPEIRTMAVILKEFAEETHKDQKEELEKLVDSFVTEMHAALGNSFSELGQVIRRTIDWQKMMLDEMKEVFLKINTLAVDLAQINQTIELSVNRVSAFTGQVEDMQGEINENLRGLNVQNEKNTELCINANDKLLLFRTENAALVDAMKEFLLQADKQTCSILDMNQNLHRRTEEEVERLSMLSRDTSDNIVKIADDSMQNMATTNAESVRVINEVVEKLLMRLNEYSRNLEIQSTDSINNLTAYTEATGENLKLQAENHYAAINSLNEVSRDRLAAAYGEMENSLKVSTETMVAGLTDSVKAIESQSVEAVQKIGELSETTRTKLAEESDAHLAEMQRVSETNIANLATAYSEMENSLKASTEAMAAGLTDSVKAIESQSVEAVRKIGELSETTRTKLAEESDAHLAEMQRVSETNRANLATAYNEMESSLKSSTEAMAVGLTGGVMAIENQSVEAVQKISNLSEKTYEELTEQNKRHLTEVQRISEDNRDHLSATYRALEADIQNRAHTVENQSVVAIKTIEELAQYTGKNLTDTAEKYLDNVHSVSVANMSNLKDAYQLMEQEITEKLKQLRDMKELIRNDIEQATQAMTTAASGLNNNMLKQINGALESFDVNLAKATSHLSGTIKDMDDTTGRVPVVINQSYINMEKAFREMQMNLDQYLEYADKLHRNLEQKWAQLNTENWK